MAGEGRILAINALLVSIASLASTFHCCGFLLTLLMRQRRRVCQRQNIVTQTDLGLVGYPTIKRLHDKMADRATCHSGLTHLCKNAKMQGC